MKIPFVLLDQAIPVPRYAHDGDAGFDLSATIDITLAPHSRATIPCGIALAIPEGYAGLVIPRSGIASKNGISVVNAPGLIDSGYRGEIKVILLNTDNEQEFTVTRGDRIAQLVIIEVPKIELLPVEVLDATERGARGFGSSGV